jgi:hypothetical protein
MPTMPKAVHTPHWRPKARRWAFPFYLGPFIELASAVLVLAGALTWAALRFAQAAP